MVPYDLANTVGEVGHRLWKMSWKRSPSMFFFWLRGFYCRMLIYSGNHSRNVLCTILSLHTDTRSAWASVRRPPYATFSFVLPFYRAYSYGAAVLINFCGGVEQDTPAPYLNPIVGWMLKLLNYTDYNANNLNVTSGNNPSQCLLELPMRGRLLWPRWIRASSFYSTSCW